jgi:superfamily II DNA/RNA helicase
MYTGSRRKIHTCIHTHNRFKENKARILISTDAAAKGIDVPNVTMVVQV